MRFRVFLDTIHALRKVLPMLMVPLHDERKLQQLASGFQVSCERENPLFGCIGALDGITSAIKKPPDEIEKKIKFTVVLTPVCLVLVNLHISRSSLIVEANRKVYTRFLRVATPSPQGRAQ